ncbi:argininosuccinate lyase [Pedobacter sp. PAMC26386]|nr:argininosuccinate lyase [Pedobacter sp. PAMC26386]
MGLTNYHKILIISVICLGSALNLNAQLIKDETLALANSDQTGVTSLHDASRIGRTSGSKATEFQELYDYETGGKSLIDATFPYQSFLHKAYVIMLCEQKIINITEAKTILKGLEKVDILANKTPSLRVYLPYESALIKEIGSVGGKMHIGRSRNDLDNTTQRMFLRDQLLNLIESIIRFRIVLKDKAIDNLETVMVVYTHRKEAQPITLAHYLTAIDESMGKVLDRYIELYSRINQSPLGSGASGGTSWPLDRVRVANLLGFDKVSINTIEGVAGWDYVAEFASDNAIYMSDLSRFASEIQLWSTDEYGSVELDNSFAGISSMMPQKKNPDALERTRKASALTVGQLISILTSLNSIEYQHSGVRLSIEPRSLNAVMAATHAMTGLTATLKINKETMLQYARQNFSTMTDLADLLVRETNLDFRDAHELIAAVVNDALSENKKADQITLKMIQKAAKKQIGHELKITEKQLQEALDPVQSVARKKGLGMPAVSSVNQMIASSNQDIKIKTNWLNTQKAKLEETNSNLKRLITNLSLIIK